MGAHLRREHGIAAYNMARQGDSLHNHYVLSRLHLDRFRPRIVLLFGYVNDTEDLGVQLTPEELKSPVEIGYDYEALSRRVRREREWPLLKRLRHRLYAYKLYGYGRDRLMRGSRAPSSAAPATGPDSPGVEGYYRSLLGDLAARGRASGAPLAFVFLRIGDTGEPETYEMLKRICRPLGIKLRDTSGIFDEGSFLLGDGHLSPAGHRQLADFVAPLVEELLASSEKKVSARRGEGDLRVTVRPRRLLATPADLVRDPCSRSQEAAWPLA